MTTDNRLQIRIPTGSEIDTWLTDRAARMHNSRDIQARTELQIWAGVLSEELCALHPPLAWMNCIADVLNGSIIPEVISCNIGLVYAEVCDAFRAARHADPTGGDISSYGVKWELDEQALLEWLLDLSPAADHAVFDAVSRWWETSQEPTPAGWAAVGVFVAKVTEGGCCDDPADTAATDAAGDSR